MHIRKKHPTPCAVVLLALIWVSICLSGCWANIPGERNRAQAPAVQRESDGDLDADSSSADPDPLPEAPLPTVAYQIQDEEIPIGESFPAHGVFRESGTLNYTVTGARVLGSDSDVTFTIDQFFPYCDVPGVAEYPNFLDDAGHLSPGCYLVQVDITAQNVDARTVEEEYGDPCLFRADDIFLIKMDASGGYTTVDYFSLGGKYDAHPMLYRLEPGEAVQYTIGFLVDETWAVEGVSSLRISQSSGTNGLKVDLQLGGSSHE